MQLVFILAQLVITFSAICIESLPINQKIAHILKVLK
ncbi:AfsR family transcriptional regulator [Helicobacter pylori]|nr:AfsR family transcriptional regulator [Helicobacter pylori]RKV60758.1 AfsR family transcriptional regulator [Helicobacter pylori]